MKKTLLFGSSNGAEAFMSHDKQDRLYLAVVDNDENKHGKKFAGLEIIPPTNISTYDYDEIVIASWWELSIKEQLINELNIDEKKIFCPPKHMLVHSYRPFEDPDTLIFAQNVIKELCGKARQIELPLYINYGCLLGIIRDGDLIKWDEDIDISALVEYADEVEAFIIANISNIDSSISWTIDRLTDVNGKTLALKIEFQTTKYKPFIISIEYIEIQKESAVMLIGLGQWTSPIHHVQKLDTFSWNSVDIYIPSDIDNYLESTYGDWKTPKKEISLSEYNNNSAIPTTNFKDAKIKQTRIFTTQKYELLNEMLKDMQNVSPLYKPTAFWEEASSMIINDLNKIELKDFRQLRSSRGLFAPVYSYQEYIDNPESFQSTIHELSTATQDEKSNLKLKLLLSGQIHAFSDYRVLQASNKDYAPYTDSVSESSIGNPKEHYIFDNRNFSRSFLNYLLGLSFMKQHVNTSKIKVVMEIGGGFGSLGEILLSDKRNDCFYINADIPPVSFVSSYYLKEVFGSDKIADYSDLKDKENLDIDELRNNYDAINICSWQIPKLKGSIDLFVNFISFQEMEPNVVQNYCNHINTLEPKYILLRNMLEGKKKKDSNTIFGVNEPILGRDYDSFFPNYKLIATDSSIFGFKTEDNFHSQLRLYARKTSSMV